MSPEVAFLLYGFVFASSLTLLTFVSTFDRMQNLFFRVMAGGSFSGVTTWYLLGVTPFLSFLEASVNGDFGFGGYFTLIGMFVLLLTWTFNLYNYKGRLIV